MLLVASIILAIVVAFIVATAERLFNGVNLFEMDENREGRKFLRVRFLNALAGARREGWIKAAIIGTTVGVINYFVSKVASCIWLEPIFLAIILGLMVYLMVWWYKDGTNLKEMICFILLAGLFYQVAKPSATLMMPILVRNVFWASLISVLPLLTLFVCLGFFITHALFYYYETGKNERNARLAHIFAWVAMILTTVAIILTLIFGVKWNAINWGSKTSTSTQNTTTETKNVSWYGFYNLSLQKDDDSTNDYNFGYNPFKEELTAKDYDQEFRKRLKVDVALGAASMAWVDANVGTRFIGVFYDEVDQKWDAAINYAKERFMKDQVLYYETLDAFFAFLDKAEVEITNAKGIDDQMYMFAGTVNGIPDVIVMETDDHTGHFLTYRFIIKDSVFEVSYRIECGFQPCDVSKIMKITPQPKPDPTPDKPDPTPDKPDPTPSKPTKDPTQGTPVGKNDDPGPGPDTNNGVGAQNSTEEKPTNSTYKSYDEYKETMAELEKVNETQKEAGDPNTPTVTPKPDTKVDSNADNGTSNGGIDESTPIQEPVHVVTPDGGTTEISDDPGTAWGGPVD